MKKVMWTLILGLLIQGVSFSQTLGYEPGELMVMFRSNDDSQKLTRDLAVIGNKNTGMVIESQLVERMNLWLYKFDYAVIGNERMLDLVRSMDYVILAQFNHTGVENRGGTVPNDSLYKNQWHHKNTGQFSGKGVGCDIDSEVAWGISTGGLSADGDTLVVAVIDAGGGRGHKETRFWNNYKEIPKNGIDDDNNGYKDDYYGWNAIKHNDSIDFSSHAGQCSGIIGAIGNNKTGVVGVNWDVQIMSVSAVWSSSSTPNATKEAYLAEGYGYIIDQRDAYNKSKGAKGTFVVATNNSFGVDGGKAVDFPIWCAMYDSLGKVGILNASACTNAKVNADNGDMPSVCPSDYIIPVMCSTYEDKMPVQSPGSSGGVAYGPKVVDLAAPTSVYTVSGFAKYSTTMQGTSFSSPQVAGAISLLVAGACPMLLADYKANPETTLKLLRKFILDNVDHPAAFLGKNATNGRLNVGSAMKAMDLYCTTLSSNTKIEGDIEVKEVFPNPATNEIFVNLGNIDVARAKVVITDLAGRQVMTSEHYDVRRNTNIKLNISLLPGGYYLLNVGDQKGTSLTYKIVKTEE